MALLRHDLKNLINKSTRTYCLNESVFRELYLFHLFHLFHFQGYFWTFVEENDNSSFSSSGFQPLVLFEKVCSLGIINNRAVIRWFVRTLMSIWKTFRILQYGYPLSILFLFFVMIYFVKWIWVQTIIAVTFFFMKIFFWCCAQFCQCQYTRWFFVFFRSSCLFLS